MFVKERGERGERGGGGRQAHAHTDGGRVGLEATVKKKTARGDG